MGCNLYDLVLDKQQPVSFEASTTKKGTREMIINLDIPSWLLIFVCVLFGIKTILELTNAWLDWKLRKASEK